MSTFLREVSGSVLPSVFPRVSSHDQSSIFRSGCYLVVQRDTVDTNCHFQLIKVVKIKKNVAVDKKSSFMFCTQFGFQNAGNGISELPDLKLFSGG